MNETIYDEAVLIRDLSRIGHEARIAFAAACAERLVPAYLVFCSRTGRGQPETLTRIIERVWAHVLGKRMTKHEVNVEVQRCAGLLPREEEGGWVVELPYAAHAGASLLYALRVLESGKPQEAAWAARRAYEAACGHVEHRLDIKSDAMVQAHPIVTAEISRQRRDLDALLAANEDEGVIVRIRERAKAESTVFFGA